MHSEAEIRKQVEARLKRWLYLFVDGALWLTAVFLWRTNGYINFGQFTGLASLLLMLWFVGVGLHLLRTIYVELRDFLVARAVERQRRYDAVSGDAEKPKRDAAAVSRFELTGDGELIEFADLDAEDSYVQRNDQRSAG